MVKPITPAEVVSHKKNIVIPDYVFTVFNHLISRNYSSGKATVKQDEVVNMIVSQYNVSSNYIFDNHLLDIEDIYREAGWGVKYDKPAYCENYEAFWEFTKKKESNAE